MYFPRNQLLNLSISLDIFFDFVYDDIEITTYLTPGKMATAHGKYVKGMKIYAYCNKHELWSKEVE